MERATLLSYLLLISRPYNLGFEINYIRRCMVCGGVMIGRARQRSILWMGDRASNNPSVFTITEMAPTRAFFWLKAPTSAFTLKTLLRHYAKQALTPRSLKLGPRRNYHEGRAVWLA